MLELLTALHIANTAIDLQFLRSHVVIYFKGTVFLIFPLTSLAGFTFLTENLYLKYFSDKHQCYSDLLLNSNIVSGVNENIVEL